MALRVFEEEFGKARIKRGMTKRLAYDAAVRDQFTGIFNAVQGVVDVMRDPKTGDHYRVVMSAEAGAATSPGMKVIKISWRPVFDKSLRVSTACTVMTGLVFHEVGHTLDTFPFLDDFRKVYGDERVGTSNRRGTWDPAKGRWVKPYDALAFTLLNIVEDKRLEVRQERRYPVCRDVFPTMLHWVALTTGMVGNKVGWNEQRTRPAMLDRVNFVTYATRYPWTAQWEASPVTRAERKWWQDWSAAYATLEDEQVEERLAAIALGLTALRSPERDSIPQPDDDDPQPGDDLPEPEEPPTTCDYPMPGGDEPGGNSPADDFDDEDDDEDDDDPQPGEGKSGGDEGEDGDDEDGEGDGDSESDEDDEDGDDFGTSGTPDLSDEEDDTDPDVPPTGWGDDDEPTDEDGEDEGEGGSGEGDDGEDGDEPTDEPGTDTGDGDEASDEDGDDTDGDGDGDGDGDESEPEPITDDYDGTETTGVDATNNGDRDAYDERNRAKWLDELITNERAIDRIDSGKYGKARIAPKNIADIIRR